MKKPKGKKVLKIKDKPEDIIIKEVLLGDSDQISKHQNINLDSNETCIAPFNESNNMRYNTNSIGYNDLNDNIKDIINDPKYSSEKRSKSAYSKQSFRTKFEKMKLKVPVIKRWNCDPTAEIIIHNLEQKIDILTYENYLLTKKIKDLLNNNKELQIGLSQNSLLLKTEKEMKDESLKISKNFEKNVTKEKNNKNLIDENERLKNENLKLSENNEVLKWTIEELRKDLNSKNKNIKKKVDENTRNNNINITSTKKEKFNPNIINPNSINQQDFLMKEGQLKELLDENESLHMKLQNLLSIDNNDINLIIKDNPETLNFNTLDINHMNELETMNNNKNEIIENLSNENAKLKQEIKSLNEELIQLKIQNNKLSINNQAENINQNNDQEVDRLLNEGIALIANEDCDENKLAISTLKNIKNGNKKRISQCMIINNKLKGLLEENKLLHNQLLIRNKDKDNCINSVNNVNKSCECEKEGNNLSYDYLINALKIKDEIIQKYKLKSDELEMKYNQLMNENKMPNRNRGKEKDYGLEDFLVGKIVNNQKEVLGERAPRFYNTNNTFCDKEDNNYRYNNYHYKSKRDFE